MAQYQVPPDTKEKEKVIGGLLNWTQFFWLIAGFVLGLLLAFGMYLATNSIAPSVIVGLIGFAAGVPFALVKKLEMPLFTYLKKKNDLKKED